ncbi:MAG: MFS transporter [Verrucomicrobiales bacterium]
MNLILNKPVAAVEEIKQSRPSTMWGLGSLCLCLLISSLGTSIANIALPTFTTAFTASFDEAQWIVLAYLIGTTSLIVGVGKIGDIVGRKQLLLIGISLFTATSLLCGLTSSLWMLIAFRFAQGVSAAIMLALSMALVGDSVAKEKIGSAMGLLGTTSAIGTALGPAIGGILIQGLGWRSIFLLNVPIGLLAFLLAARYLPGDRPSYRERGRYDAVGTLLLAFTLAAYALALTIGRGHFGVINVTLFATAAMGVSLFLFSQKQNTFPLLQLKEIKEPGLVPALMMTLLVSTVMMATLVVGPFFLSQGLGYETSMVGMIMAAGPLVAALAGVPSGKSVDRFGAERMTMLGLVGIGGGSFLLVVTTGRFGLAGYVLSIVIITAGYAQFQAANNTAILSKANKNNRGLLSGVLNLFRNLGLITGTGLMGAVFAYGSRRSDITTASAEGAYNGLRLTFIFATMLMAVAIATFLASRGRKASANRKAAPLLVKT